MLSLFPQILFLAPFSATLMRLAIFGILAYATWRHFGAPGLAPRIWGIFEIAGAILLLAGAWVQVVVIFVFLGLLGELFFLKYRTFPKSTVMLVLVMCVSLLVTGAGAIAFDLPL